MKCFIASHLCMLFGTRDWQIHKYICLSMFHWKLRWLFQFTCCYCWLCASYVHLAWAWKRGSMCQCGSPRGSAAENVDLDTVNTGLQHLFDSLHAHCTMVPLSPAHIPLHPYSCCSLTRSPWLSKLACVRVFVQKHVCVQQILYVTDPLVWDDAVFTVPPPLPPSLIKAATGKKKKKKRV